MGVAAPRVPERGGGYSLDLDSTVFERYGGRKRKRGYNPRKHGRASHHPLLAVLEKRFYSPRLAAERERARPAGWWNF